MKAWQKAGFVFTGILGVCLHFLFEWTGESVLTAPFSAVNESIFEHMKLLFFPMLLFAVLERRAAPNPDFWCIKLRGILLSVGLIPVLYYTLSGIFGGIPDFVNVVIFFVAAAAGYLWEARQFSKKRASFVNPRLCIAVLVAVALLFAVFTFFPPHIPFFADPMMGTYGFFGVKS